jgi:7-cyano-7-deazaguanine synthase
VNVVLAYSGGLDSTVLLHHLLADRAGVRCLSVDYGQRHGRELSSAARLCWAAGVEHQVARMAGLRKLLTGSSQTSELPVPEGHYAEESMRLTVVPNRNMLLLAACAAWAVSCRSDAVAYAAHAGDHAVYPDCREEFAAAMAQALSLCDWRPVRLLRPFVGWSKADVVRRGAELKAPLGETWSCYKGGEAHCGRCGTCCERAEAFALAGVPDPTEYEDKDFWKTACAAS